MSGHRGRERRALGPGKEQPSHMSPQRLWFTAAMALTLAATTETISAPVKSERLLEMISNYLRSRPDPVRDAASP